MRFLILLFASVFITAPFITAPALADCTNPAGSAGTMDYFSAPDNTFKFCNGTEWIKTGSPHFTTVRAWLNGGATLTCPAGYSVLTCNSVAYNASGTGVCGLFANGEGCTLNPCSGSYYATATCYK